MSSILRAIHVLRRLLFLANTEALSIKLELNYRFLGIPLMISHEHRCIFIHIPKCAGTSIESALGHFSDYSGKGMKDHRTIRHLEPVNIHAFLTRENQRILRQRFSVHRPESRNPRNRFTVNSAEFEGYYKFTVVRDPWSRIYSWWRNEKREARELMGKKQFPAFDVFAQRVAGRGLMAPIDFYLNRFNGAPCQMDKIVRFEKLHEQLGEVASEATVPSLSALPHVLKSDDRYDLHKIYSKELKFFIAKVYASEIDRFDFSFSR